MKTSTGRLFLPAALALLLSAGCAATPRVASNHSPRTVTDTWATETPRADVNLRQDAYANNTPAGQRKRFVTGSLVPQDVTVVGNSANTALPTRVYGQGDLRRRGSGLSTAEGLSRVDPALAITNGRGG